MTSALFGVGTFGLLGLFVLGPLLAFPVYYFQRRILGRRAPESAYSPFFPATLDILIPAHNEAQPISDTLISVQRAIEHLATAALSRRPPEITVRVGADGCTDHTAGAAGKFPSVSVTEFPEKKGKWATLKALVEASSADWVILADAGILWPENLLVDFARQMDAEPSALGLAPSYRPLNAGWLARRLWQLETSLKKIESLSGGPVSLHGATVAYKTVSLKRTLAFLGDTAWLNDDVVIPLSLRALYPEGLILYPVGQVHDAGGSHDRLDLGRRKRMLIGNLQWVGVLLPRCFRLNPVVGILAIRRLFRMFWAYWLGCIALGLALAFHSLALPAIVAAAMAMALSGSGRQMAGAAWVSFLAPYRIARLERSPEVSWK